MALSLGISSHSEDHRENATRSLSIYRFITGNVCLFVGLFRLTLVCLFVCLFVWVKPEYLYFAPCVWREVITPENGCTRTYALWCRI